MDDELWEQQNIHLLFKPLVEENRLQIWSLLDEMLSAWIHKKAHGIFLKFFPQTLGSAHLHGNIGYKLWYLDPLEHRSLDFGGLHSAVSIHTGLPDL